MEEKNNTRTLMLIPVFSLLFLGASCSVFAQEVATSSETSLKPVTFTVTIGKVTCNGGSGVSKVSLLNEPTVGGYYEVTGDMITKNNITLSREVGLPTGTYQWTGFANNGYEVSGKTSGEFTVGKCSAPAVTSQTLTGVPLASPQKKVEQAVPKNIEISEVPEEDIASSSKTEAALPLDSSKEQNRNKVVAGVLLLAVVVGYFGFRKEKKEVI